MAKISPLLGPVERIPIKDICLDPDNPRLGKDSKVKKMNQDDLLKHYLNVESDAIAKWKSKIQRSGVSEPIYVIHAPKNHPCKYVVKEGNVRLAILKHLIEEQEKGNIEHPEGKISHVVNDEMKLERVRWDVIPAQIYKKGTKDPEIQLHLLLQMRNILELLKRDTDKLNHDAWSKIEEAKQSGMPIGKFFEMEADSDFTREELEKIAMKLGLGKPPEKMSIKVIKLMIKYRLEFGT